MGPGTSVLSWGTEGSSGKTDEAYDEYRLANCAIRAALVVLWTDLNIWMNLLGVGDFIYYGDGWGWDPEDMCRNLYAGG